MARSMTGFGIGNLSDDTGEFTIEIKTVNHRYCDINIKMPKTLICLEDRIRKVIQKKIHRGKVDVFINRNNLRKKGIKVDLNEELVDNYVECLRNIQCRYNIDDKISLALITKFPDAVNVQEEQEDIEEVWNDIICEPLNEAIDMLVSMREKEGIKLKQNILCKCDAIKDLVNKIEIKSPVVVEEYRDKLKKKLEELLGDYSIDENRVMTEVTIFADKACIDEEIVRMKSHIIQLKETLEHDEPIGRKLDFIVQEMNRETNTIASKANNLDITNYALTIKNEIEKIREQIQNIE
ncbi:YicC family protein [Clostridium fermenticellae]|uniref:YicC family protein n=1 Tax=Clostridium fermenticellae TaxID=2068654 RepID=A0A386H2R9_9CLOT|nr:YicC/YloC family endoribonuclease [Clostridium fermenticellae]AYD40007.1 YicC family protein [Clostridium fermenticellae]